MENETSRPLIRLTIGKLAQSCGIGVETIKFYEKKGMLPKPNRPTQGFRVYPDEYIFRIQFIKRSQQLGFTLREIKDLLQLRVDKRATCGQVMKRADLKIKEIELKIKDLQHIRKSLTQIRSCCADGELTLNECPILDHFKPQGPKV